MKRPRFILALSLIATVVLAQDTPPAPESASVETLKPAAKTAGTNSPAKAGTGAKESADGAGTKPVAEGESASTNTAASAKGSADKTASDNEVQLSLQGANIDMVVQWLAQNTGKTVIKHPRVQCQITITSSKKLPKREAIMLVYRALALESATVTESSNAILITPEGSEPKMSPELIDGSHKDIPEGRQRLVKIFPLQHMQPAELKEKVRGVLSEKGTIDTDDLNKQLVVTDYTENLRLLAELIKEFDVAASDSAVEIYILKYADAEEVGNLIGLILNVSASASASAPKPSSSSPSGGDSSGPPPGMSGDFPPGGGGRPSRGSGPAPGGLGSQISAPQVRIWPDKTANRLIVSAAKSKLPEVQRLIEILDTDKPEDVIVRVIPLKNVTAVDLVRELVPIYQKLSGRTRKDVIEVGANERSNSMIVLSSQANFEAIQKLVVSLDTEDAQEKVVQTFILKNADATDVAKQLQELNNQSDTSSRYPYYYFFGSSSQNDKGRKKLSVVADRRRNSLVVQAPPNQMEGINKMIQELDEPVSDDSLAPRIFHLKYVSAVDIEDVLNELFLKKVQRNIPYWYDEGQEPQADRDVGRLYGKVRITSEPYSNTIIVTSNSKENLLVVEEVLKQLDSPSEAGESTLRIGLKFAKASLVANSINILFAKNGSPPLRQVGQQPQQGNQPQQQQQQQQNSTYQAGFDLEQEAKEEGYYPWLGGQPDNPRSSDGRSAARPVSDLVGRVRAVADLRSNALLISANVHYFPQVLKLIEELDAPTDQVLIEARLLEVSSDFLDKLGVRWSPDGSQVFTGDDFDNSFVAHGGGQYQSGVGGHTSINTPLSPNSAVATLANPVQALTTLRSGVLSSTINMDFLVQFLRRNTDAKVLAEPQINIRDNETGRLFVGQQVPIPANTQISTVGGQNTSFTYKDVGVVLEVSPHINSEGDVELRIHAESSTVVPGQIVLGGAVFDTRNFRTDLTAKNGQTLVLGGIIQKQISDTLRKTPILGSIPGLGWVFKKKDKDSRDVELMVFMRPKVTRTPGETRDLLDEIYHKLPRIKQWDDQIQKPDPGSGKHGQG